MPKLLFGKHVLHRKGKKNYVVVTAKQPDNAAIVEQMWIALGISLLNWAANSHASTDII